MTSQGDSTHGRSALLPLTVTTIGVVYGDIGTSPLYAMRECFYGAHAVALSRANILGVLSLIFWSLVIVVTLKYQVYVIHFDNRGEGGILALMGLVSMDRSRRAAFRATFIILGVFGAALLYGDGMITPAISVLGAVEGLKIAAPFFADYVIPSPSSSSSCCSCCNGAGRPASARCSGRSCWCGSSPSPCSACAGS